MNVKTEQKTPRKNENSNLFPHTFLVDFSYAQMCVILYVLFNRVLTNS